MIFLSRKAKLALLGLAALVLASCAETTETVAVAPDPLGDFKLGFVTVFADNAEKGPLSREATPDELEFGLKNEMDRAFQAYNGTKFYNLAVSVDTYILAIPGIPLVASPKSALIVSLNIWDDAKGERIGEEHQQFTILEKITGGSLIFGSGLTQSKEEQLIGLQKSAVKRIEAWLQENKQLFEPEPVAAIEG
ncbi:MAG: hypothetical protein ACI861_000527 [Paracoccaceae bacterium]|jgi:hypothetical protein